jgi:acetyl-CoA carboxylase biotin carboxyl carrier protein
VTRKLSVSLCAPCRFNPGSIQSPQAPAPDAPATQAAGYAIKSLMVGTFYRSSSTGSNAFVDIGSVVREAYGLNHRGRRDLNEIEADKSGTITKIAVENGRPSAGQPCS